MPTLPADSVDAIVTDPPYGLSFMGKHWDHGIPGEAFWREALRVAKPGAHLLAFGGSRTYHRLTCAIEDAGWEIRDCLMWVYGSGFPKSRNLDGGWDGWGTALKPAYEPVVLARKPFPGTVAANVLAHGTGAINVDACRVGTETTTTHGKRNGTGNSLEWSKTTSPDGWKGGVNVGRWPANFLHDGSPEVVELFPEAARFFYCPKASKRDRDEGLESSGDKTLHRVNPGGLENDPRWKPITRKNNHPTVKPTALMRYLCRLITPPGGIVLDPFCGSGSTGKAAVLEGFGFVGIEMETEYAEIAEARLKHAKGLQPALNM